MKISKVHYFCSDITPFQGFSSGETDFHFCQFLSNFLRYSFSNFLLSYLYNILTIYFFGSSFFLKSLSSVISNFFCCLISTFILPLNLVTTSFAFPKSSSLFYVSCSAINPFHYTKYLTTSLIFLLFKTFFTFHSSTPSTSTSFTSSTFCSSTCSLYYTIQLTFTIRWIFIQVSNCNLTVLVDITSLILYEPTY